MLTATDLELVVAGRQLLEPATFQVAPGDRIGLVGRNGAGKTTLAKVLAGEALATAGIVRCTEPVAYLPQDPRTGDLDVRAVDRILGARDLDRVMHQLDAARHAMSDEDPERQDTAMRKYSRLEERFHTLGGWTAEAEAASIASSLGLPERVLEQRIGTLSGGQRRRVELARVLFSEAPTLVLDEPTNHLDIESIEGLLEGLLKFEGTVLFVSHDHHFVSRLATRVIELKDRPPGHKLRGADAGEYNGTYEELLERDAQRRTA
jgi:ATPase subunit of ABC transporter with duplicated ATPase domains